MTEIISANRVGRWFKTGAWPLGSKSMYDGEADGDAMPAGN